MNRCLPEFMHRLARSLPSLLLAVVLAQSVQAQTVQRKFPKQALRGNLVVTSPPQVELDGKPEKLAPGARIHGPNNLLVMSGSLRGQPLVVNYVRERNGLIHEIWILTAREAEQERASAPTGRNYMFGSETKAASGPEGR